MILAENLNTFGRWQMSKRGMQLTPIVEKIERIASGHPFGKLQEIRNRIKNIGRVHHRIFQLQSIFEKGDWSYAFHYGGRSELQFNVGFEDEGQVLRHGVAFSFERNRNFTDLDVLRPAVSRFNDFISTHSDRFSDFSMWHFEGSVRSDRHPLSRIFDSLFRWGVFVVVGRVQPAAQIDYELIVEDFDRLLSLYEFVEGNGGFPLLDTSSAGFIFKPGCSIRALSSVASIKKRELDVDLRHKQIQVALHDHLVSRYGRANVGTECANAGIFVDLMVRRHDEYWFYEVKTSNSARGCVREALSQLLEYSFWPGAQQAVKLVIVGEPPLERETKAYLSVLRDRFGLPVEYQQFVLDGRSV